MIDVTFLKIELIVRFNILKSFNIRVSFINFEKQILLQ